MALRGFLTAQPDWRRVSFPAVAWLTWGAVDGTTAGDRLQVQYAVSKPAVTSARLVLADGRELAMTVYADRLELLLSPDTPDGPATVIAELDDGMGSTASAGLVVLLHGIPVVPAKPAGGMPGRARRELRLVRADAGRVRLLAEAERLRRHETPVVLTLRSATRARIERLPGARVRSAGRVRVLASPETVRAMVRAGGASSGVRVGETAVAHRDGPAFEEALLLNLL